MEKNFVLRFAYPTVETLFCFDILIAIPFEEMLVTNSLWNPSQITTLLACIFMFHVAHFCILNAPENRKSYGIMLDTPFINLL